MPSVFSKLLQMNIENGYLELIIGPMFAGKSTELFRKIDIYRKINKNVLIINHSLNSRYGFTSSSLVTHDKKVIENVMEVSELGQIEDKLIEDSDLIVIDELQFFKDGYENVIKFVEEYKKHVVCAGLDGDFNRKPFGDVLRLIPLCDNIIKLKALCKKCGDGKEALFSKKIIVSNRGGQVEVGSNDIYIPVCRNCFLEKN